MFWLRLICEDLAKTAATWKRMLSKKQSADVKYGWRKVRTLDYSDERPHGYSLCVGGLCTQLSWLSHSAHVTKTNHGVKRSSSIWWHNSGREYMVQNVNGFHFYCCHHKSIRKRRRVSRKSARRKIGNGMTRCSQRMKRRCSFGSW